MLNHFCLCITPHIQYRQEYVTNNLFINIFGLNAMHSGLAVFKANHGINTDEYPKSSCHRIDNMS